MKAEFTKEGYIKVTAETIAEGFAMAHILNMSDGKPSKSTLFDYSVLDKDSK